MKMTKQLKNKSSKYSLFSILVLLLYTAISSIPMNVQAVNQDEIIAQNIPINIPSNLSIDEKYMYTFKISDKLKGKGDIKLIIDKDQIKGIASGIGKTSIYEVSFNTNIKGFLNSPNKDNDIEVAISGIGDPIGIPIPGKVTFQGPLKGIISQDKLSFVGTVHIKGRLAKCAGFKNEEEILIEIPNIDISRTLSHIEL